MNNNIKDIKSSLQGTSKYIYIFTVLLTSLATVSDLITVENGLYHKINNIAILIIFAVSAIAFYLNKIPLKTNFCIISYLILLNIIISDILNIENENILFLFLKNTQSLVILLPILGIVVNKAHTLIFGAIYLSYYTFLVLYTRNISLQENFITILVLFTAYSICMYFIIRILENIINKQELLNNQVNLQNQELILQAKNLGEINQLLSEQTSEIRTQQKELKKLNSTKDKFLSLFAHDLKSPMSSIIGISEILENQYDGLSEDKRKKFIRYIRQSSHSTYKLLDNLLEWSRSQSNNIAYSPQKVELSEIVGDVISHLSPNAKKKQIELIDSTPPNIKVLADKYMITTVLRNFSSNAIKYSNAEGKIEISCLIRDTKVRLSVTDSGIGMTEKQLESLFKIEHAESTVGTNGEKGTGLGLLICKDFIKKHDSKIEVTSNPGEGSQFSFELDLTK